MIADSPWDVQAYRQRDPRFPNHSTADQFFDDAKFEAYRALGRFTAARALDAMEAKQQVGLRGPITSVSVIPPTPSSGGPAEGIVTTPDLLTLVEEPAKSD